MLLTFQTLLRRATEIVELSGYLGLIWFFTFAANLPTLESGVTPNQFDNIVLEFLRDQKVADMVNAMEALTFEYTYWPQRQNYSWIRQELIDVSVDK